MKIQDVKYIEILKINVKMYSEEPNNDFQCWIFEEEKEEKNSLHQE